MSDGKAIVLSISRAPTVGGPLAFAAYNPAVATALLNLHDGAVNGTLQAHARELAILVACRETNYTFEWNAHVAAALDAGVGQNVIDAVREDRPPAGLPSADAAVIRFGREMLRDRAMSSETFDEAVELFGERGAMDLVAVMSTYAVSGFCAIAVDETRPGRPCSSRCNDSRGNFSIRRRIVRIRLTSTRPSPVRSARDGNPAQSIAAGHSTVAGPTTAASVSQCFTEKSVRARTTGAAAPSHLRKARRARAKTGALLYSRMSPSGRRRPTIATKNYSV